MPMWVYGRGMEHRSVDTAAVVEVDEPLATAVVAVLRRRGCPAWTVESDEGYVVLVPRDRREEALRLVAAAMDELAASRDDRPPPPIEDGEEAGRRLLLPRLRDSAIAILLVPLLVVALSAVNFPAQYAAAVVVAGIAAVVVLRIRARDDGSS